MALKQFTRASVIGIVDDVVEIKHAMRLVSAEFSIRDALRDSGAHHVSDGCPAQIMNDNSREASLLAGRFPSLSKITDRLAVIMEHEPTVRTPLFVRWFNDFKKLPR
jgi:hypothetical protein